MNLRKASMYLFVSIFVVCAAKLFVMIKINELSSEVSQLNEEIKFHEKLKKDFYLNETIFVLNDLIEQTISPN